MKSAAHQLAYHFLDLPFHEQVAIAEHFGVEWKDRAQAEFHHLLFKTANDTHRLAELWDEVEKRHPEGDKGVNPYRP